MPYDLEAATAAAVQHIAGLQLLVEWLEAEGDPELLPLRDLTGLAAEWEIQRQIVGAEPEGIMEVSGVAAAQLTALLGGGRIGNKVGTAQYWLGEYRSSSPTYGWRRYGIPVTADFTHTNLDAPEDKRLFTGSTVDLPADQQTIELTALDGWEDLRGLLRIPMVLRDEGDNLKMPGLNAQWVIDWLLRQCGYYASPPPLEDCIALLTMHGSAYPEIGTLFEARVKSPIFAGAFTQSSPPTFAQGRFALAIDGVPFVDGDDCQQISVLLDTSVGISADPGAKWTTECWADVGSTSTVTVASLTCPDFDGPDAVIGVSGGQMVAQVTRSDGGAATTVNGPTIPSTGKHYLRWRLEYGSSNIRVRFDMDATTADVTQSTAAGSINADFDMVTTFAERSIESLQIAAGVNHPSNYGFTPTAILEPSLNELDVIPVTGEVEPGETAKDVASAEQASIGFDENGVVFFWSRDHWVTAERSVQVQHELSTSKEITRSSYDSSKRRVRNIITVPVTVYTIEDYAPIWEAAGTEPITVPADDSIEFWVNFTNPSTAVLTDFDRPIPDPLTFENSWYDAYLIPDGQGDPVTSGITIEIAALFGGSAKIAITNTNSDPVYLVDSGGRPALKIIGRPITSTTHEITDHDDASIAAYGPEAHKAPANDWLQRMSSGARRVADLLFQLKDPRVKLNELPLVGNPLILLGDLCRITIKGEIRVEIEAWATGLKHKGSRKDGYTTDFTGLEFTRSPLE